MPNLLIVLGALAVLGGRTTDNANERKPPRSATGLSEMPYWGWESSGTVCVSTKDGISLSLLCKGMLPCAELHDTALVLLCCRQSRIRYFMKPNPRRCWRRVFMSILLIIAEIEQNPGPS